MEAELNYFLKLQETASHEKAERDFRSVSLTDTCCFSSQSKPQFCSTGIEFSNTRCEVWTRSIGSSAMASGSQCLKHLGPCPQQTWSLFLFS